MYIPFEEMPKHARVWIYQASRPLSAAEEAYARHLGQVFSSRWSAHGNALRSSVEVRYRQFLIIAVDEQYNQASGCSIDASVGLVRELEQKFSTAAQPFSFLDRSKIAFLHGEEVRLESTQKLKDKIKAGQILPEMLTFNNLVSDKAQFDSEWMVPAKSSWLARYF